MGYAVKSKDFSGKTSISRARIYREPRRSRLVIVVLRQLDFLHDDQREADELLDVLLAAPVDVLFPAAFEHFFHPLQLSQSDLLHDSELASRPTMAGVAR